MIRSLITLLFLFAMPLSAEAVTDGSAAPPVTSSLWLNSEPLNMEALRGSVVLVEFWTFGCYNCRNVEPRIKQWYSRYHDSGLILIGVHTPEFAFERDPDNLRDYIARQEINYPVAVDNHFDIWHAWHNRAWPTLYLVDKQGIVRYRRIGEGGYETTERMIRSLLAE